MSNRRKFSRNLEPILSFLCQHLLLSYELVSDLESGTGYEFVLRKFRKTWKFLIAFQNAKVNLRVRSSSQRSREIDTLSSGSPPTSDESGRPIGHEEEKFNRGEWMTGLPEEASDQMDMDCGSLMKVSKALESVKDGPFGRSDVCDMMEDAVNQLTDKLDFRGAQITEDYLIRIMANNGDDHHMLFARGALQRDTRDILISTMDDEEMREAFEAAIIQVAANALWCRQLLRLWC